MVAGLLGEWEEVDGWMRPTIKSGYKHSYRQTTTYQLLTPTPPPPNNTNNQTGASFQYTSSPQPAQPPTGAEALQALNSLLQDTRSRRPAPQSSSGTGNGNPYMPSRFLYAYGGGGGGGKGAGAAGSGSGGVGVEGVRAWKAEYQKHG